MNAGQNVRGDYNIATGAYAGADVAGSNNQASGLGAGRGVVGDGNIATGMGAGFKVQGNGNVALGNGAGRDVTADNTVSIGTGARAGAANSVALGAGSTADRGAQSGYEAYGLDAPQSSSGELNVGNRQITGVAAGSAGNDAVNVDQLRGAMSMFNRSLGGLSERIDSVEKHAYAGTAAAMAARQAPFVPGKFSYAANVANYKGQSALGVSLRHTAANGAWSVEGGLAGSGNGVGAFVGVGGVF